MRKSRFLAVALTLCLVSSVALAQTSVPAEGSKDVTVTVTPSGTTPAATPTPTGGGATTQPGGGKGNSDGGFFGGGSTPLFVMMGLVVLMLLWSSRSRKKQEAKRKELLNSLKKGDKVVTIGGIMGTVLEIREGEVTVKTDESNNVKMKFARWAIRDVGESAKADAKSDEKKE